MTQVITDHFLLHAPSTSLCFSPSFRLRSHCGEPRGLFSRNEGGMSKGSKRHDDTAFRVMPTRESWRSTRRSTQKRDGARGRRGGWIGAGS